MTPADIAFHTDPTQFAGKVWALDLPAPDRMAESLREATALIRACGLFDANYYLVTNQDLTATEIDPMRHYHEMGWRQGRRPNPYFDPAWYIETYTDVHELGTDPLIHYIRYGEAEGRRPILYFDPTWYRTAHAVPDDVSALAHFLARRTSGEVSPLPEFDSGWYLRSYPDVAQAGMDPFEHYLVQGYRENRDPSPRFDARFYRRRHLRDLPGENPLLHYLKNQEQTDISPVMPQGETSLPLEVKRTTSPHPAFELRRPLPDHLPRRARLLAYYLPQFHDSPENAAWWGEGFTEWTNLGRALPRFAGHYQPRIPRDLGHYRLDGPEILRRQTRMAHEAGLSGFIFYFYWFNGRRLLERPLEIFLADRENDFPFCLMWCNENWTRRWDGSEQEVLITQDYRAADEPALLATFARHFADPRYIRLQGRPLLMIYRPGLIPHAARSIARWRRRFRDVYHEDPIFVMSQSFGDTSPHVFGVDGAIEFPPHKLVEGAPLITDRLDYLDDACTAQVYDYADIVARSVASPAPGFPLIRTVMPGWDNDARRQGSGLVVHGATPSAYQAWLERLIARAADDPFFGDKLVCINAWNEWAEGAYLEPDVHFGAAFLNATGRAATGLAPPTAAAHLMLVGHDAFRAGAQLLLLHLGQHLKRVHNVAVEFLLLGDGALRPQYEAVAGVTVLTDPHAIDRHLAERHAAGVRAALVNSAASASICPQLAAHGIGATLLIHEMPRLLQEKALLEGARAAASAERLVFPAACVRERFAAEVLDHKTTHLVTQGLYRPVAFSREARLRLRRQFGVPHDANLAIGIGYADLRKGFDLFLQIWRSIQRRRGHAHLLWVGAIDPTLHTYLGAEIDAAIAGGRFHMTGWREDVGALLSAADMLLLPSREDPYPAVALEALSCGLPVVAFAGSGGIADFLSGAKRNAVAGSAVVKMGDADAMAAFVLRARPRGKGRRNLLSSAHDFATYTSTLLRLARPDLLRISVVVLSFNYARYLSKRLASIFAQTYPVWEIIVLDDGSDDDSPAVARALAAEWQREIRVIEGVKPSGSVFAQWARAANLATGEYLWIAEADDACAPNFLERLVASLWRVPDAVLAFSDSRCIDAEGAPIRASYRDYYAASAGPGALARDDVFDALGFLRRFLSERNLILNGSAVLWRREAMAQALERCGADLPTWRLAGDWRLYTEVLGTGVGRVVYVAEPLNTHRVHNASATAQLDRAAHLAEIARMHTILRGRLAPEPTLRQRQATYLRCLRAQFRADLK
jgi:glycosyltransferase involved in cell wall biosynthesis